LFQRKNKNLPISLIPELLPAVPKHYDLFLQPNLSLIEKSADCFMSVEEAPIFTKYFPVSSEI
jgi:hypothetical protein